MGVLGQLLLHPEEIWPLVRRARGLRPAEPRAPLNCDSRCAARASSQIKMRQEAIAVTKLPKDEDLAFCYGMLNDVSRRRAPA